MKKILLALAAVALLFATSCKKENVNPAIDVPEGSFLATIDNGANPQNAPVVKDGMGTMTTIDANNFVIWETGDEISINGSTYTTTSTPGNTVVFSGGNATGPKYHAFYPATIAGTGAAGTLPATQVIISDIATGANKVSNLPMYANSESNQLTFENICAALKVNVPIACDSIVVSAHQPICGNFAIAYDETKPYADMATAAATDTIITVIKEQSGSFAAAEIAYVAIPAGTYTNFIVKFYDGASIVGQKTLASLTVAVNKVYNLNIPMELCFTYVKQGVGQSNCTIKLSQTFSPDPISLETCTYNASTKTYTNWVSYAVDGDIVLNNVGDKVYFRAGDNGNATFSKGTLDYYSFTASDTVEVSGNIMTLLSQNPTTTLTTKFVFYSLFEGMKTLKSAENLVLPATTLKTSCYAYMFMGCTGLKTAPALPATTLADYCYYYMFKGCTSLTTAPALPATTLVDNCYAYMFRGCTSLTTAPALPATTLADYCYAYMFEDCTSLTTAPALPATTLAQYCYARMFSGCSLLTSVTMKASNVDASFCLYDWLFDAGPSTVKTIYLDSDVYSNGQAGSGTYYSTYTTIMNTASGWTPAAAPAQ